MTPEQLNLVWTARGWWDSKLNKYWSLDVDLYSVMLEQQLHDISAGERVTSAAVEAAKANKEAAQAKYAAAEKSYAAKYPDQNIAEFMEGSEEDRELRKANSELIAAEKAAVGAAEKRYELDVDKPKPPKPADPWSEFKPYGGEFFKVEGGRPVGTGVYYGAGTGGTGGTGRYDTPVDIARQKLAELAEQRRADEFKITQDFNVAKAAAEQSLARDRLKWDEASALGRRETDVYGNLLTSFSQMTPYAVPPGVEYIPGMGPGESQEALNRALQLPYDPEKYRTVMKYSPEDIWAMSGQLTRK